MQIRPVVADALQKFKSTAHAAARLTTSEAAAAQTQSALQALDVALGRLELTPEEMGAIAAALQEERFAAAVSRLGMESPFGDSIEALVVAKATLGRHEGRLFELNQKNLKVEELTAVLSDQMDVLALQRLHGMKKAKTFDLMMLFASASGFAIPHDVLTRLLTPSEQKRLTASDAKLRVAERQEDHWVWSSREKSTFFEQVLAIMPERAPELAKQMARLGKAMQESPATSEQARLWAPFAALADRPEQLAAAIDTITDEHRQRAVYDSLKLLEQVPGFEAVADARVRLDKRGAFRMATGIIETSVRNIVTASFGPADAPIDPAKLQTMRDERERATRQLQAEVAAHHLVAQPGYNWPVVAVDLATWMRIFDVPTPETPAQLRDLASRIEAGSSSLALSVVVLGKLLAHVDDPTAFSAALHTQISEPYRDTDYAEQMKALALLTARMIADGLGARGAPLRAAIAAGESVPVVTVPST